MSAEPRVRLRVSNQTAYVWDVDDIAIVRAKHHICGILTGTLPHLSQQNVFLGVPMVLMPEEVVLLVEKELAVIIDDTHAHHQSSPASFQQYNDERIEAINLQISLAGAKEATNTCRAMSDEALRKRKARQDKKAQQSVKVLAASEECAECISVPEPPTVVPVASDSSAVAPLYTVTVPASSSSLPWYAPSQSIYTTIESARTAGVWVYPSTPHERAKCGVFKGLWESGYFLGCGIKFGGDYLVYPGDPLRYHSHFVASVHDTPTSTLRPMEIVAHGRLGTATKKAHLICGWDQAKKEVSYFSIEWAGFG